VQAAFKPAGEISSRCRNPAADRGHAVLASRRGGGDHLTQRGSQQLPGLPAAARRDHAHRPSGGPGAGYSAFAAARQACAALRPSGGFRRGFGGGGQFGAAIQAFRSCMAAHGEAVPAARPTARPTAQPSPGNNRFLNGLNASDPEVAAALKACQSKLPAFGRPPASAG
jgi:hypothetical protein